MQPLSVFAGVCNDSNKGTNWGKYSWESHTYQVYALAFKMSNAAFCGICMEKKSENVAIYPKHIWESRSHSSWATTAGVTGACIPHDWIPACSALLRHRLEPQLEQSNISAFLESSRVWLGCLPLSWRSFWFATLSETPDNTPSLLCNMPDPDSLHNYLNSILGTFRSAWKSVSALIDSIPQEKELKEKLTISITSPKMGKECGLFKEWIQTLTHAIVLINTKEFR